jgi:hypothetical protein
VTKEKECMARAPARMWLARHRPGAVWGGWGPKSTVGGCVSQLGAARRGGVHGAGAAARVWLARRRPGAKCVRMEGGGVAGNPKEQ